MTVCAKALSSSYEECCFVEPVTISQPAANPATFSYQWKKTKQDLLHLFPKKDYKVIQRHGKFVLNYTAQNTAEAGEGPANRASCSGTQGPRQLKDRLSFPFQHGNTLFKQLCPCDVARSSDLFWFHCGVSDPAQQSGPADRNVFSQIYHNSCTQCINHRVMSIFAVLASQKSVWISAFLSFRKVQLRMLRFL